MVSKDFKLKQLKFCSVHRWASWSALSLFVISIKLPVSHLILVLSWYTLYFVPYIGSGAAEAQHVTCSVQLYNHSFSLCSQGRQRETNPHLPLLLSPGGSKVLPDQRGTQNPSCEFWIWPILSWPKRHDRKEQLEVLTWAPPPPRKTISVAWIQNLVQTRT